MAVQTNGHFFVLRASCKKRGEDTFEFDAFSSDYIANILEQRQRLAPQPGPLHLTRRAELLDVELGPADLSSYQP